MFDPHLTITSTHVHYAIQAEHDHETQRRALEVIAMICHDINPESVDQLCDFIDLQGGTQEVRRYVSNWRKMVTDPRRI